MGTGEIPRGGRIEFSPSHTALKRNPDRSFSSDCRAISDLRRINLWMNKSDTFPVFAPSISQICERVISLKTRYPGISVRIAKRDISGAFKRVPLHPDCSRVFVRSFDSVDLGTRFKCCIGFLALPYGFLASPSYFAMTTAPIQCIHQSFKPDDCARQDADRYSAFLYIDDSIFVEVNLGRRDDDCIALWEEISKKTFLIRIVLMRRRAL